MKLLKTFTDQLEGIGRIQRVWLTSFVINIEFIEGYLLPSILNMDRPKLRMDYEGMQQELTDREIDLQVFCDKRFIEPDQNKRTAIPVHGVSPERLPGNGSIQFSEESLFHPKVIFLQGDEGAVLGTGSANLTVDGWGRNREVFYFEPVNNDTLADSVAAFFRAVFENVGEPFRWDIELSSKQRDEQGVAFCHSFTGPGLLQRLLQANPSELAVWSPFFAGDLGSFVRSLHRVAGYSSMKVHVVPDRVENQYLRTRLTDELEELHKDGLVRFCASPLQSDDRVTMTHAKLWKTADALAIGSWNCTQPGSNLILDGADSRCNVEAGLVFRDTSEVSDYIGEALPLTDELFATSEQLEKERLKIPQPSPFDLQVIFDWQTERYVVTGVWLGQAQPDARYTLKLPGLDSELTLRWSVGQKSADLERIECRPQRVKDLLANHRYDVHRDSSPISSDLIIEKRADYRRAQQYEDLRGLLDALVLSRGEPSSDEVNYRVQETDDGQVLVDALREETIEVSAQNNDDITEISYFRLFSACHHYVEILAACQGIKDLEYWAFSRPGCLQELTEKTKERIEAASSPSMFNWFLAKEVNRLCDQARLARQRLNGKDSDITTERWVALKVHEPSLPASLSKEYQDWLVTEYERLSSNNQEAG